jgi:predicted ATPase
MPRAALLTATRFHDLVAPRNEIAKMLYGHQMMTRAFHYLGDQVAARRCVDEVLAQLDDAVAIPRWYTYFQADHAMFTRVILARILWLHGYPEQAARLSIAAVEDVLAYGHPQWSCYQLIGVGIPIALLLDDRRMATRYVNALMEQAVRGHMPIFEVCARCFEGALRVQTGDFAAGAHALRRAVDELTHTGFTMHLLMFLSFLAEGLGQSGQVVEGLAVIDEALAESERNEARWYLAELLRVRGELVLREGAAAAQYTAEQCFRQGIECARQQGALAWELRCSTSMARLCHAHGRTLEARAMLAAVYDRFTEGHDTEDVLAAKALLDRLH